MTNKQERKLFIEQNVPKKLLDVFQDDNLHLVGGAVRDLLLGVHPKDLDFAIPLPVLDVKQKLIKANIPHFNLGEKFGTLVAHMNGQNFEITSLREEVAYKGRFPSVLFTNSFEKDAVRRDFTINALYISLDGELLDFFEGKKDLKTRTIKFIENPKERILEDPLRILRFYRFWGQIEGVGESESRKACSKHMELINTLSPERIWAEFSKILSHPTRYMILKSLSDDHFLWDMKISEKLKIMEPLNPLTALASLNIKDLPCPFSNKDLNMVKKLKTLEGQYHYKTLLLEHELDLIQELVILNFLNGIHREEELHSIKRELQSMIIPLFPLRGEDLLPFVQGKELGETLKKTKDFWMESPETRDKEACLKFALSSLQSI